MSNKGHFNFNATLIAFNQSGKYVSIVEILAVLSEFRAAYCDFDSTDIKKNHPGLRFLLGFFLIYVWGNFTGVPSEKNTSANALVYYS